ncbi:peptidylprolyl isomerase [Paragemmobacter straminiformis]|uniref:Parvulin-like PPIase n=1 Tax=Paragemmobacter straminiformis TaxID=2045119 RepID=A0A842I9X4_9RHOB|nr:peptidylprolyl isomerase [Gemmobacter straminiformis]MBC2836213.1 peptidylprolyl isomerase [Gemmobacter straminiformis]
MAKHTGFWMGLALACATALPALAQDAPTVDTVVATVNGEAITLGELIVMREKLPAQYQQIPDDALFKGLIEQAVQQLALEQSVTEGKTKRDELWLKTDARGYMAGKALQSVVTAGVTEEAIKAAYDEKYAKAPDTTEYSAAHILVDSEDKAKELKAKIDGGADFAELAKANSSDTGSAVNGGDLGWFGPGMMVKPFEDAVVALKPGEVSGPVKSDFGWHIIKLNETRVAAKPDLEAVRQELTEALQQKVIGDHIAKLTAEAKVEKPGEGLDPALLRDATLFDK